MEETQQYNATGETMDKRNCYLAAQKLKDFLRQFDAMSDKEKQVCIARVDELCPGLLIDFYNRLKEYIK